MGNAAAISAPAARAALDVTDQLSALAAGELVVDQRADRVVVETAQRRDGSSADSLCMIGACGRSARKMSGADRKSRLLLVENHTTFAEAVIAQFLGGYEVAHVTSLAAARAAVEAGEPYDFILVDYDLDDGKGDALVPVVREFAALGDGRRHLGARGRQRADCGRPGQSRPARSWTSRRSTRSSRGCASSDRRVLASSLISGRD